MLQESIGHFRNFKRITSSGFELFINLIGTEIEEMWHKLEDSYSCKSGANYPSSILPLSSPDGHMPVNCPFYFALPSQFLLLLPQPPPSPPAFQFFGHCKVGIGAHNTLWCRHISILLKHISLSKCIVVTLKVDPFEYPDLTMNIFTQHSKLIYPNAVSHINSPSPVAFQCK